MERLIDSDIMILSLKKIFFDENDMLFKIKCKHLAKFFLECIGGICRERG